MSISIREAIPKSPGKTSRSGRSEWCHRCAGKIGGIGKGPDQRLHDAGVRRNGHRHPGPDEISGEHSRHDVVIPRSRPAETRGGLSPVAKEGSRLSRSAVVGDADADGDLCARTRIDWSLIGGDSAVPGRIVADPDILADPHRAGVRIRLEASVDGSVTNQESGFDGAVCS